MPAPDSLISKNQEKVSAQGMGKASVDHFRKAPEPEPEFRWPTPPYAVYNAAKPWNEPQDCELEGLTGVIRRCKLLNLNAAKHIIHLSIETSPTPVSLSFAQFRRLTLKPQLFPREVITPDQFAEILGYKSTLEYDIKMLTGEPVCGLTIGYVETDYGVFLFPPVGDQGSVEQVFIPREAFSSFAAGGKIGHLLVQDQAVTEKQVEQAANEQKDMRSRKLGDYLLDTAVVYPEQLMLALSQQSKMPMIRMGEALTLMGYISSEQLRQALERQKAERSVPLGELLIRMGFLSRHDLNIALARKMGYPMVDVKLFPVDAAALTSIPMVTAKRLKVMPLLSRDNLTVVASVDPTQRKMIEELEFLVQGRVIATLGDELQIKQKIVETYEKFGLHRSVLSEDLPGFSDHDKDQLSSTDLLESMEHGDLSGADSDELDKPIEQSDNTLVRLINTMIIEAYNRGVSDIHVESQPRRAKVRIRFRKDGILFPYLELPANYRAALVARLKIMADLDISENRKPQDGKINFSKFSAKHRLELRIATIPTTNRLEDVVMRLLTSSKPIAMDKLLLSDTNLAQLRDAVSRPYGMVLCVGPTGSGKTTTLHSILSYLNTPERKIWTAEDPVEITQPDLRQVQVNPKIDWTFAKALRSFLRADPDIIMVGEIRDAETARIAIEASLTGHLLLSTLHTNSAAETITRLVDMGMDPFNFADSLLAVLAQRLVRKLCTSCVVMEPASDAYVNELLSDYLAVFPADLRPARDEVLAQWLQQFGHKGVLNRYHSAGCPECKGTGLAGRLAIQELLMVSAGIRHLIQTSAHPELIQAEAFKSGKFRTLRQDGISKVLAGLTSIEEARANSNV
ncbi:ATPase, T2SS/T4P/T4SS family [Rhodoferax sp.]|uniref:GspE/PulE family protein n=1 Tax=Rhodoferax sp. TaxID=50421 RepID=UPI0025CDC493|nr:ATPase, T2SS/T4P/T4SS family [Rhodoferax sp.]